jgi:hypothetical protein
MPLGLYRRLFRFYLVLIGTANFLSVSFADKTAKISFIFCDGNQ